MGECNLVTILSAISMQTCNSLIIPKSHMESSLYRVAGDVRSVPACSRLSMTSSSK